MATPRKPKPEKVGIDSINQTNSKAIVLAVVGVIVVLALIAVGFALSNKDNPDVASDVVEFRPVKITGNSLPPEYSDADQKQLNEAVGAQAPEINGSNFKGDSVNITKDGRGKVVIFVAHWCPHCQREVPLLSKWIPANKAKYSKVDFYLIATSSTPTRANFPPSDWLKKENWPTPIIADDNTFTAGGAFGLGSYPYMLFLDGDNKVVTRTSGELAMTDFGNLVQQTQDTLDHKPISTTSTTEAPQSKTNAQ